MQKFRARVTEVTASCKVEDMSSAEVENSLALAMFTVGVDDPEWVKLLWKEKWSFTDLSRNLKEAQVTKKVLKSVEPSSQKVKQEPIGKIGKKSNAGSCIRCGEKPSRKGHLEKCPAKSKKCSLRSEERSKSRKKKPKIIKVREEVSDNSENPDASLSDFSAGDESDSTSSCDYSSEDSDPVARVVEVKRTKIPLKRNKKGDLIGKVKELSLKDKKRTQLKLIANGTEITAMLDTGSPISLMPKNISKRLNFQNEQEPPKDRRFVDLNGNDVVIRETFTAPTQLFDASSDITSLEVNARTTPILGMDAFKKIETEANPGC